MDAGTSDVGTGGNSCTGVITSSKSLLALLGICSLGFDPSKMMARVSDSGSAHLWSSTLPCSTARQMPWLAILHNVHACMAQAAHYQRLDAAESWHPDASELTSPTCSQTQAFQKPPRHAAAETENIVTPIRLTAVHMRFALVVAALIAASQVGPTPCVCACMHRDAFRQ
jgi:hypothetical protein